MSNHLAIATVSATLGRLAHRAAQAAVGGVTLQFGRPTAPATGEKKLHVYLYQITPNAQLRNADLPTRASDGRLTRRSQAALDLHYLLSFYGDDQALEPDRMLGAVARDLHAHAVLTSQDIDDAVAAAPVLTGSDLGSALESVKFTPMQLTLEDLSRLWSVMVQTPHALSVPYVGTVVLIDAEDAPQPVLPVLRRGDGDRGVDTRMGPFPRLDSYWAGWPASLHRGPRPPSLPAAQLGARLEVEGANLGGDSVFLRFVHPRLGAAQQLAVGVSDRTPKKLHVGLPDDAPAQDAWASGIYSVSAVCDRGGTVHTSNAVPVVVAPRVTSVPTGPVQRVAGTATLNIGCHPKVLPAQEASLLLLDREVSAQPHNVATDTLTFEIDNAPAVSQQLVRLRIDGVESLPVVYDELAGVFAFDDGQRVTIT